MALLLLPMSVPAFSARPVLTRAARTPRTASAQCSLPQMYRERWKDEAVATDAAAIFDESVLVLRAMGAFVGVSLAAYAGAEASVAMTDSSVAMLAQAYGWSASIPFVDATMDVVDVRRLARKSGHARA